MTKFDSSAQKSRLKIVFLGTPDFAVNILESLLAADFLVAAVVTQADKPRNRGEITYSPVKEYAIKNNLRVFDFRSIKKEGVETLKQLAPDIMITAAYGQILSQEILDIAPLGVINVHASLLPKYRGAAPIQWALICGEEKTGVTIMKTGIGLDTGDIILKKEYVIPPEADAGQVFADLSALGAEALIEALRLIENGKAVYTKQGEGTHFPMLRKQDGKIDWNKTAPEICSFVRGVNPWPGAFTQKEEKVYKIHKAETFTANLKENNNTTIGIVLYSDQKNGIIVACKGGTVKILELQQAGGKRLRAEEFLRGNRLEIGTKFE